MPKLPRWTAAEAEKGFPHGMCTTQAEVINRDLLSFVES